tara:strand:+ start:139 stop:318 length:180 start_codon:yes stop_codon:yes gene_type:complete
MLIMVSMFNKTFYTTVNPYWVEQAKIRNLNTEKKRQAWLKSKQNKELKNDTRTRQERKT